MEPCNKVEGYAHLRKRVLERDDYRCRMCESNKQLQVHHIIPACLPFDECNEMTNLITLCIDHHKILRVSPWIIKKNKLRIWTADMNPDKPK